MPRFARMLAEGMRERGHTVELWAPRARFFELPFEGALKKWLGYIDQYIVFPTEVRKRLKNYSANTLFVFTDHALGPWVPLVAHRNHVIHCHDFMAQQSALGRISENFTGWTGRRYQSLIHRGYSAGKNFISVSHKTRADLHQLLPTKPSSSEVVYNGLNKSLHFLDPTEARLHFGERTKLNLSSGYLLHVGGNQWYKNREGVIKVYEAWRTTNETKLPLLLIGEALSVELSELVDESKYKEDIHLLSGLSDEFVNMAYAGSSVFLFPSLAEGFGWPIAEAMACGGLVITTDEAPMTEVAGDAAFLVPRRPKGDSLTHKWALDVAHVINTILNLSSAERDTYVQLGLANAKRFESNPLLSQIENIYKEILQRTAAI